MADLGRHARGGDHELAGPARGVRVHEDHVGAVAERDLLAVAVDGVDALRDRQALAGERRLRHFERRRVQEPSVRGDDVARLDRDDVAGHELVGRDLGELAVAPNLRLDDHHLLQRGDCCSRLSFLVQAEHGVENGEEEQHEAGAVLAQRDDAAHACNEQHDLHRVVVLADERVPARLGRRFGELVRAVLRLP